MKVNIYNTDKKYSVIYADPPWSYADVHTWHKMGGGVKKHYKTMEIKEIDNMGEVINKISEENCLLFMWVTFPNLKEGLNVIEKWGFKYKTLGFSWIKLNKKNKKPCFGIGYYTKSNCEVCLIGIKGKPGKVIKDNTVSSCIISERREHSRKPDEARERIEKLVGKVPKIELFARQEVEGWDCWGNEI